jgi:tripartite-type tricarboxylate transporter receptor subunit TctC
MSIYRRCILSVLSAVLMEGAVPNSGVFAHTFPSRALRLVVPFAVGSTDVVAEIRTQGRIHDTPVSARVMDPRSTAAR